MGNPAEECERFDVAYPAAFDQPSLAYPIKIPGIRSGFGAKRRVRGWSGGGLDLGLGFQTFVAVHESTAKNQRQAPAITGSTRAGP